MGKRTDYFPRRSLALAAAAFMSISAMFSVQRCCGFAAMLWNICGFIVSGNQLFGRC
jgi:hypothetical protein